MVPMPHLEVSHLDYILSNSGVMTQALRPYFYYFLFIYDNWNWVLHVLQLGKGWLEGLV